MKPAEPILEQAEAPYWCFISYRHADNHEQDRNWASWLHQEIERFDVPAELVGTRNKRGHVIPKRIYPVFRDEESLPADANLANSIVSALDRSWFMVALCSPRSVASQYCTQEIHRFKQTGKQDRIIAAILSGEPNGESSECFPLPLRHPVMEDGTVDTSITEEPIAADFRIKDGKEAKEGFTSAEAYRLHLIASGQFRKSEIKKRTEAYEGQLQLMKLKIIAGILGVPLEQLRDRDKVYQLELAQQRARTLRRWLFLVGILAVVALAAGWFANNRRIFANAQRTYAEDQRRRAEIKLHHAGSERATLAQALQDLGYYALPVEELLLRKGETYSLQVPINEGWNYFVTVSPADGDHNAKTIFLESLSDVGKSLNFSKSQGASGIVTVLDGQYTGEMIVHFGPTDAFDESVPCEFVVFAGRQNPKANSRRSRGSARAAP